MVPKLSGICMDHAVSRSSEHLDLVDAEKDSDVEHKRRKTSPASVYLDI